MPLRIIHPANKNILRGWWTSLGNDGDVTMITPPAPYRVSLLVRKSSAEQP
jgi:hypothetical protein